MSNLRHSCYDCNAVVNEDFMIQISVRCKVPNVHTSTYTPYRYETVHVCVSCDEKRWPRKEDHAHRRNYPSSP